MFDVLKRSCRESRHESRHHTLRLHYPFPRAPPPPNKNKTKNPRQTSKQKQQEKEAEDQSLLRTIQAKILLFTIFHGDSTGFSQASEGGDLGEGFSLAR